MRLAGAGGAVADWMVSEMVVLPVRACASLSVTLSVLAPGVVAAATVALKEQMLSPGAASPYVPLSKSVCEALPPIGVRSAVAVMPVLVGDWAGVTCMVRSV